MNIVNIRDIEYMALYKGSKTLNELTKLFKLELDYVHYRPKDLNFKSGEHYFEFQTFGLFFFLGKHSGKRKQIIC